MRLTLNLERHCVETEIRRLYNQRLRQCLGDPGRLDTDGAELELLVQALKTLDFQMLRARYPELRGGMIGRSGVFLVLENGMAPLIEIPPFPAGNQS
jgi:hypothetical protein